MDEQRRIGRRAILRSAGVALALPPLMSLFRGAKARAQDVAPRRLLVFYTANGLPFQNHATRANAWFPTPASGGGWSPSTILEPIATLKQDVTVLKGIANRPAYLEPGGHPSGTGGFLTCAQVKTTPTRQVGVSMDQMVAKKIGVETKMPSLVAGIPTPHSCAVLPCVFRENISWITPEQPAPRITDPQVAFDLLFGDPDNPEATLQERRARLARRKSVLDALTTQATRLRNQLAGC